MLMMLLPSEKLPPFIPLISLDAFDALRAVSIIKTLVIEQTVYCAHFLTAFFSRLFSSTMLALQRVSKSSDTCTTNILPCRIHHDGPAKVTKRYWSPQAEKGTLEGVNDISSTQYWGRADQSNGSTDGTKSSHFRGRKLRGRVMKLPAGYEGTRECCAWLRVERRVREGADTTVQKELLQDRPSDICLSPRRPDPHPHTRRSTKTLRSRTKRRPHQSR